MLWHFLSIAAFGSLFGIITPSYAQMSEAMYLKHFAVSLPLPSGISFPLGSLESEGDVSSRIAEILSQPELAASFARSYGPDSLVWYYAEKLQGFPGNNDIDADGIANLLDPDPFDPNRSVVDSDSDGLPNHIDWDVNNDGTPDALGISQSMVDLQLRVFKKYKIYAFNSSTARHSESSLALLDGALSSLFESVINGNDGSFPGLLFFVAGPQDSNPNTKGWHHGHKNLIYITLSGISQTKLSLYKTIVHELGHAFQKYLELKFGRDLALDDYLSKFWTGEFLFRGQPEEYWWEEVGKEFQATMNSTAKATLGCGIDYCPCLTRTAFENNIMRLYSISNRKEYFADSVLSYALMHMLENTPAEVRKFHLNNMNFELKLNPEAIPPEGIEFLGTHLPLSRPLNILESGR